MTTVKQRAHHRSDGRPKVPLDEDKAVLFAALKTSNGQPRSAYACPHCPAWHVGRMSTKTMVRGLLLVEELGDRAAWNLVAEHIGPGESRLRRITGRCRRAA